MITCKTCFACGLQSSGLVETVCWACCLSCGRVCCAQGCNGGRTAHFLSSLHHSSQLAMWLHSHFELRDIVLFLSACDIIFLWNSSYETSWMKSCSVCNKKKSPRFILLDLFWKQSCMWTPCASKPGSLDNVLEFVRSMLRIDIYMNLMEFSLSKLSWVETPHQTCLFIPFSFYWLWKIPLPRNLKLPGLRQWLWWFLFF